MGNIKQVEKLDNKTTFVIVKHIYENKVQDKSLNICA